MSGRNLKCLILCGGEGTRLRPFTNTTTKQLLPVANRPIVFYLLDMITRTGIEDIGIIISSRWGRHVQEAIGDGSRWNSRITYIWQDEALGLAHAVKIAQPFLGDSPFLMVLGDNIYRFNIEEYVDNFEKHSVDASLLVKQVDDPSAFGIAEIDGEGNVTRVVEKPKVPMSNMALAGIYLFSASIHQAISRIKPSARGELEITDAIQELIEMRGQVKGHELDGWWLDTGTRGDLLKANEKALNEFMDPAISGYIDHTSSVSGNVTIGKGTVVNSSEIRGPVCIGEGCLILNSTIEPFTCIGNQAKITNSTIERALVMDNCLIRDLHFLFNSVVGNDGEVFPAEREKLSV